MIVECPDMILFGYSLEKKVNVQIVGNNLIRKALEKLSGRPLKWFQEGIEKPNLSKSTLTAKKKHAPR